MRLDTCSFSLSLSFYARFEDNEKLYKFENISIKYILKLKIVEFEQFFRKVNT